MVRSSIIFETVFHTFLSPLSLFFYARLFVATFIIRLQYQCFISIFGPFLRQPCSIHCDSKVSSFLFAQNQITDNASNNTWFFVISLYFIDSDTWIKLYDIITKVLKKQFRWKRWLFFYRQNTRYLKQESIDNGNKAASMKRRLP